MGGKSGGNEAELARQEEQQRQAKVRAGTQRVNTIFNGGKYGFGGVQANAAYDPTKTYYTANGSVWTPTNTGTGTGGETGGAGGGSWADLIKSGQLFTGVRQAEGFGENFFNGRRDAYANYANPQLEQQYGDANKQLTFALDRSGLLNSSARGEKAGDLQQLYDLNKQEVADKALSYSTQAKSSLEDVRANLISTLNATGDTEGAVNSALTRSKILSEPAAYSPLGQLFSDFTNTLGIQAAQERSFAAGGPRPRYETGLFGGRGRVTVR